MRVFDSHEEEEQSKNERSQAADTRQQQEKGQSRNTNPISPSLVIRSWSRSQAPKFPIMGIVGGTSSYILLLRNGTRHTVHIEYNVPGETALNTSLKVAITRSSFSSPRLV